MSSANKTPLFTKYVPLTEAEFRNYQETQNKHIRNVREEIERPPAVAPLVQAVDEKQQLLFNSTLPPELKEKLYQELTHIIDGLKQKLRNTPIAPPLLPKKVALQPIQLNSIVASHRARQIQETLGPDVWTDKEELSIDGESIPGSSRHSLMDYVASDWKTKFNKAPTGLKQMLNLVKEKNIPSTALGKGARSRMKSGNGNQQLTHPTGEEILDDPVLFREFMNK